MESYTFPKFFSSLQHQPDKMTPTITPIKTTVEPSVSRGYGCMEGETQIPDLWEPLNWPTAWFHLMYVHGWTLLLYALAAATSPSLCCVEQRLATRLPHRYSPSSYHCSL
jgi:hypothetical protein